jgi:hypothetical protein
MDAFKIFDAYSLRARLFPALLASAPLLVSLGVIVPWHRLSIAHVAGAVAVPVILFAMADIARRVGKAREPHLYRKWGSMPTTVMMRHADSVLDVNVKTAYLRFLAMKLKTTAPTAQQEMTSPDSADAFYSRCAGWLRENTRDTKKFGILFNENVTYGFRRNLYALKWPTLVVDALIFIVAVAVALYARPNVESELALKLLSLMGLSTVHGAFISFITEASVRDAARIYARQLFLSCEVLGATATKLPQTKTGGKGARTGAPH